MEDSSRAITVSSVLVRLRQLPVFARGVVGLVLTATLLATVGAALAASSVQGAVADEKPEANKDHWHMAYGIYNCTKYLPALKADADPTGVHTHGDGLIHIHPFAAAAAGANATLQRFFDAVGFAVTGNTITLQDGSKLKSGGKCGSTKATVRTLLWSTRKTKTPTVVKDPGSLRLADQAIVAFVYAPPDATIPMPSSVAELEDPADLPPPVLSAAAVAALPKAGMKPKPVGITGNPPTVLTTKDLTVGAGAEAKNGTRIYVRYSLYIWRGQQEIATSSWKDGEQPEALNRLGKGRLLLGLDKGLVGMKVGGVRQIVIPPAQGFGSVGSPPVKGDDTLIFLAQLVAVTE